MGVQLHASLNNITKSNISQQPEINSYDTLFLVLDFEEGEEDEFIKFRIFQLAQYQYYYVEMLDLWLNSFQSDFKMW